MISRNKGILSFEFLVPVLGLLFAAIVVNTWYELSVIPQANKANAQRKLLAAQSANGIAPEVKDRSFHIIIQDLESRWEIVFWLWGMIILGYKLAHVNQERGLLKHDFVRVQPGERIIPQDALDRYKELKAAVEQESRWRERLLPECILASLHRFHATRSVQDAATAVRERAELAGDELDSALGMVRYIAWAIPALGFIGTVRGIGDALNSAEAAIKGDIAAVTDKLGLAFNTTFVGLATCIVLMFFMHLVMARQEAFIIETQALCRDKLIDVMKVPTPEETAVPGSFA
ncbi:MAG: MotA/TolQ/ExbB proton channel family protein [Opitutaceae bacterium]|nr:MotA/TolQ/ExbB proton channel family protein [Opitutaceae bacterium]